MTPPAAKKAPPENTDAWIPADAGDSLVGEVIDVDTAWSDWRARQDPNDPEAGWYPLLTIREKDTGQEVKLHGFRTILFNELIKREPIIGEKIIVTYLGQGRDKGDGTNPAEVFRVRVEGRPPEASRQVYRSLRGRGRSGPSSTPPAGTTGTEEGGTPTSTEPEISPDDVPY